MPETVLFVPGFPGSHLVGAEGTHFYPAGSFSNPLLLGPNDLADDGVRPGDPIQRTLKLLLLDLLDLGKQAASLYELLDGIGCRTVPFGWDWRRPVWDATAGVGVMPRLLAAIRQQHQIAGGPITLIVHSTGGLVLRSLLEAHPEVAPLLRRVLSFGVPWAGLVKPFREFLGQGGIPIVLGAERSREIVSRAWAAYDLLPPDTAAGLGMVSRAGVGDVSPLVDRAWLAALPGPERAAAQPRVMAAAEHLVDRSRGFEIGGQGLEIINVVGWGHATIDRAEVSNTGSSVTLRERSSLQDTDTLGFEGGDGTVPRRSAAWLQPGGNVRVTTFHVPVGWLPELKTRLHTSLWRNPGGRNLLRHLLGGSPLEPFVYAALDAADIAPGSNGPSVRVRAVALDPNGRPLPGAALRSVDLEGPGGQPSEPFDPANDGRHVMRLRRSRMNPTPLTGGGTAFRFGVEITWQEGGGTRSTGRIGFAFQQP